MTRNQLSFKRYLKNLKKTDRQLLQSGSSTFGARTYFRNKTNTAQFLKFIGEQIPTIAGYYRPGESLPDLKEGKYYCKPELGWGGQGVFDIEVTNRYIQSEKKNVKTDHLDFFFKSLNLDSIYLIEERIFDKNDPLKINGVTDYKFHCFQGLQTPLALIKNRILGYSIWVDWNMNVVDCGKINSYPAHIFNSLKNRLLINGSNKINSIIRKLPVESRGIDTFKHLETGHIFHSQNLHPIDEFKEFNEEDFIKVRDHADKLMSKIPLSYCRIDLFNSKKGVVVGELTPIPGGGHRFYPEYDHMLGEYVQKAKKNFKKRIQNGHFARIVNHPEINFQFE